MPEGKCTKCGTKYYGWALIYKPETRACDKCKGDVKVTEGKSSA